MPAHCKPAPDFDVMIIADTAEGALIALEISRAMLHGYRTLYEVLLVNGAEVFEVKPCGQ